MSDRPELRPGPPWAMEEMIAAEPGLVEPVLTAAAAAEVAERVSAAVAAQEPVVIAGCGTSEHAAMAGAAMLRQALGRNVVGARDAFEASLDAQNGGVLIAVSHEAGTPATLAAAEAAAERGAQVAFVTAPPERVPAGALVYATALVDTSWCHTVGYLSPVLALHAVAAHLGGARPSPAPARAAVEAGAPRPQDLPEGAPPPAARGRPRPGWSGAGEVQV